MTNIGTLARRELAVFFLSPIAYVVMAAFLAVMGIFFSTLIFVPGSEASLRPLFEGLVTPVLLLVVIPPMTMRLFSEEFRSGTIEKLMTAPVSEVDVVLGKFLAAVAFYAVLLASTLLYVILIRAFGRPDWGLLLGSYFGVFLLGVLYTAVGVFFSSVTRNQVIACICSVILLLVFTVLAQYLSQQCQGWARLLLQQLSIADHLRTFVRGLVDVNHLVFFISTTGLFLFLTVKVLESRRWR